MEVGLFGVVGFVVGAAFVARLGAPPLWGGAYLAVSVGAYLGAAPGNTTLVDWVNRPTGVVPVDVAAYLGGTLNGAAEFKSVALAVFGVALLIYLGSPPSGYEPLVVAIIAVGAGLLTVSYDNLVVLYLCLELQALGVYTLVGLYRFDDERTDTAVRYLLAGSLVSGFLLAGFVRGYAVNGTFQVGEFTRADPVGSAWVVGVLLFKAGAAPFHFWSPVVCSPLEWGTLSVVVGAAKVNVWYLLGRTFSGSTTWWVVTTAGVASVVVGSLGGYYQVTAGGTLAYSGIVNSGYLLLLVAAPVEDNLFGFVYYLVVYLLGTALLIATLSVYPDTRTSTFGTTTRLGGAVPLVVYYLALNLGGLPVFPGFFAKVTLVEGLLSYGFVLTGLVVGLSVVPAVYYVALAGPGLFEFSDREGWTPAEVSPGVTAYLTVGVNGLAGGVWSVR